LRVVCQEISHKIRLFFASNFLLFFVNKFYLKNALFFASIIYKIMNARDSEFFHQFSGRRKWNYFQKTYDFFAQKAVFCAFFFAIRAFLCTFAENVDLKHKNYYENYPEF